MQTRAILSAFFISFLWMVRAAPQGISHPDSKDVITEASDLPAELVAALYYFSEEDAEGARTQGADDRFLLRRDDSSTIDKQSLKGLKDLIAKFKAAKKE
ncbi:hypothetical protein BKA70DRAFT_1441568 [Coprinopsis sp. MPI-PUGE-AT-0042]|nr:hypothetical protein BKA70DRAFT_1441568 [Coprinopsis sp. MPI-PUGE-AT-0042]